MNKLPVELKVEIASYVEIPFFLGCCSRDWHKIVNSPHTKYKWLLNKYGRIHALFHAVKIGEPLLNFEAAELILKNSHISRHFIHRLKLGYGKRGLWGSNISNDVYERILNYKAEYASCNCDDMQSIRQILEGTGSEDDIRTIIEIHNFTPFPPSSTFRTYVFENSAAESDNPHSNGYATASEMKIVANAIISYPKLLDTWRKIGYHEVTTDLENPVVQLTLLNICSTSVPSIQTVTQKLCDLQSIGFLLTGTLIGNALLLFERRLSDVGESLIEGFSIARKMSKADVREMCLIDLLDPARNIEQHDALDYIINSVNNPEKQILSAFEKYSIVENGNNPSLSHVFLKYSPIVYRHMLRFGAKSPVVGYLMKEIVIVNTQIINTEDSDELRYAANILDEYCAADIPFERSLLPLFKECPRTKPISYLFKGYLAKLFGFEAQHQSFSASQIPEIDVITSPTQTEELQRLWLEDIQKFVKSEELVNDEFKTQATEFFALCCSMHSCFDYRATLLSLSVNL
ncbi:10776_t:CDS:1 [Paraglomus brasilianum]|uniref:10776_t:CDS:1 n=1 Tax=Paraglomus brasilianum TaxID=144538 RepID=A0A9N9C596_9GLOM|nr:10776_t:CDS:1 [Paraglomus brasilianum]